MRLQLKAVPVSPSTGEIANINPIGLLYRGLFLCIGFSIMSHPLHVAHLHLSDFGDCQER